MSMPAGARRAPQGYKLENAAFQNFIPTIRRLWTEMSASRGILAVVFALVAMNAALGIAGPFLIGYTIDIFVYHEGAGLKILLPGIVLVYLFYSLTTFLQNYFMIGAAQNTVYSMRKKLFEHLQNLPLAFFDKRQHGELMSRITNDMDNVSNALNSSVIQILSSVFVLAGTAAVMILLSPLLTLFTFIVIPLMFFGMRWITKRTSVHYKEQQRYLGELNGFIEESVSGQKIIKIFSREEEMMEQFLRKSRRLRNAGFSAQLYAGFIPKLMNMLNNLSFALIAFLGGILAIKGHVSIGVMVTFTEYSRQFTRPLNDLANQFNVLLSAVAGAERVFAILDEEKEEADEAKARDLSSIAGEVEFAQVHFSYGKKENTIIDANFRVKPGETIALVGPTGAGKTTIINLLARFYDAGRGSIQIDGNNIVTVKRSSLRRQMGFVLQDVFLFEGTIRENIRYGRLDATDEEVVEAAKKANAHSFIVRLPEGYDTVLKDGGGGISQGQKQLISIARAILKDPAILILDEATSNIDTVTELKIQEALQELMKGRTTFIIAHRINTIQNADLILVLNEGRIIEQGSHQSLIEQKGFYYRLYRSKGSAEAG